MGQDNKENCEHCRIEITETAKTGALKRLVCRLGFDPRLIEEDAWSLRSSVAEGPTNQFESWIAATQVAIDHYYKSLIDQARLRGRGEARELAIESRSRELVAAFGLLVPDHDNWNAVLQALMEHVSDLRARVMMSEIKITPIAEPMVLKPGTPFSYCACDEPESIPVVPGSGGKTGPELLALLRQIALTIPEKYRSDAAWSHEKISPTINAWLEDVHKQYAMKIAEIRNDYSRELEQETNECLRLKEELDAIREKLDGVLQVHIEEVFPALKVAEDAERERKACEEGPAVLSFRDISSASENNLHREIHGVHEYVLQYETISGQRMEHLKDMLTELCATANSLYGGDPHYEEESDAPGNKLVDPS